MKTMAKTNKVMAIGRPAISKGFPLNNIKDWRTLFSIVGARTTPIIKGAIGNFHLRRKYPMSPEMIMIQTSNIEFLTL